MVEGQRIVIDAMDMRIAESLRETFALWEHGALNRGDLEERIFTLATETNIDKVLSRLPAPWADVLLAQLQGWAEGPDREPLFIFGGIYAYETEPNPLKAAEMRRELEEQQAADVKHFKEVILPIIRTWWAKRTSTAR